MPLRTKNTMQTFDMQVRSLAWVGCLDTFGTTYNRKAHLTCITLARGSPCLFPALATAIFCCCKFKVHSTSNPSKPQIPLLWQFFLGQHVSYAVRARWWTIQDWNDWTEWALIIVSTCTGGKSTLKLRMENMTYIHVDMNFEWYVRLAE
jgi:hypothetical protein